ncbi:PLP-dependent aminotransferase family protein [Gluconacetobacter azotocaptans]|uniref:PLP-dependent aminotransferase family protein n=1 Tax=Gluconacetobacter azotocaptans TaxID=142834 RepID=A0A7W4PCG8_9PROT|nr:PLP-dependent aminotransferase family protein [Gluconacetobacter azotocaptans]MBB2188683.1 PLP-dependent aminotransferase family protein [Gluconacetobacter azotocaptans]GBQ35093.1 GntR family transcriptional regulator [Gluconacetobacter azotocaptans DSM 13594]
MVFSFPFHVDPAHPRPLVSQIVQTLAERIGDGSLAPGSRLPSVRRLAAQCGVSTLTVSNAYNRLVADGALEARPARGYFVAARPRHQARDVPAPVATSVDSLWLLQRAYEENSPLLKAGGGWLPEEYLFTDAIRHALAVQARRPDPAIMRYGNPYGHPGLRQSIRLLLAQQQIACGDGSIILTHGASQALELAIRCVIRPGDTVLVDDPGYSNLYPTLQSLGARIVGVPRLQDGPCLEHLDRLARHHAARLFVTNTRLHNPTGTSYSAPVAHQALMLAERHDFLIVEDDIFAGLAPEDTVTLARLDQLRRVIHVSSFSKTISPGLRVGFLACRPDLAQHVLRLKMAGSLTSSGLGESIVHTILTEGRYRLHLARVRDRLATARKSLCDALDAAGLDLFCRPEGGMFVWAAPRRPTDMRALAERAATQDIMLAPGCLFRPDQAETPWMRLNVIHANDPRLFQFLREAMPDRDAARPPA